jgi:hypothetical protein
MRIVILSIAALWFARIGAAADFDPYQGPKPLAAFIQSDPWAMVIGSDTPRVAIYENGDVIFVKDVGGSLAYHHISLGKDQLETARARLAPVLKLRQLKPRYNLSPNVTDQPEAMFYLRDGDREIATSVYGLSGRDIKQPASTKRTALADPAAPPEELIKLHEWLYGLDFSGSKAWTPKYVEVMFWGYSYAPEASIHWPNDWPSLNSSRSIKRGDMYSIYLDGSLLPKLREFLSARSERGAVEIEGQKMAVSYRFAFPGERTWRKAFAPTARERQDRE